MHHQLGHVLAGRCLVVPVCHLYLVPLVHQLQVRQNFLVREHHHAVDHQLVLVRAHHLVVRQCQQAVVRVRHLVVRQHQQAVVRVRHLVVHHQMDCCPAEVPLI